MRLSAYRNKRDFKRTAEPRDSARHRPSKKGKRLAFVVQKHHASHLHYDFRLEMNGVLKSWAVPKGPSKRPGEKRLAVMVEDHPLAYATFEGTIPRGQYGAGRVEIWDRGTYDTISGSIRGGEFVIGLRGIKLKGQYALVRMRSLRNWLLIKKKK